MSSTAAPSAESVPAREINPSDMRAVAESLPDDFMDLAEDSPSSDHERHEREDEDLSPEARAAAEGLDLGEGGGDGEPESEEDGERREPKEGDEEREQQAREGEEKGVETGKVDLRDDARVTIDGREMTGREVRDSLMMRADYTRKTMELGEHRRALEGEFQKVQQEKSEIEYLLGLVTDVGRNMMPRAPNMQDYNLSTQEGLAAYVQHKHFFEQNAQIVEKVAQAYHSTQQQQNADRQRSAQEHEQRQSQATQQQREAEQQRLQNEVRLIHEKVPELRTDEGRRSFYADVEKYGPKIGLTLDHVQAFDNHVQFAVTVRALKLEKLEAATKAVEKRALAAPPIRPAARQASGTRAGDPQRAALDRFRREPSVRTAAATITDAEMGF